MESTARRPLRLFTLMTVLCIVMGIASRVEAGLELSLDTALVTDQVAEMAVPDSIPEIDPCAGSLTAPDLSVHSGTGLTWAESSHSVGFEVVRLCEWLSEPANHVTEVRYPHLMMDVPIARSCTV